MIKAVKTTLLYAFLLCSASAQIFAATLDGGPPPFGSSVQEIRNDDILEKAELYKRATIRSNTVTIPVSPNRIVITSAAVPVLALSDGISIDFVAVGNNSGATTIALDSTAETAFNNIDGSALVGGEIVTGRQYHARYNATSLQWWLASSLPGTAVTNAPAGNIAAINSQSALNELDVEKAGLALTNLFTADQTIQGPTGATLNLNSAKTTGAVSDVLATITVNANNASNAAKVWTQISSVINVATAGAENSRLLFNSIQGGTLANRLQLGAGVFTTNATGGDKGADTFNALNYFVNNVNISAIYQAINADLTCYAGLGANGMLARTGAGTCAVRTQTGTGNEITVTNGSGAAGNPTYSLPNALTFTGKTITDGTFNAIALNGTLGATTPSTVKATSYTLTGLVSSTTAPTVSGFCTAPSVPNNNGTAAFTINVGTVCATSTGTITLPAATTGWVCSVFDITTPATNIVNMTGGTTTTVTLTNYVRTTGIAGNFTSSDVLRVMCSAY